MTVFLGLGMNFLVLAIQIAIWTRWTWTTMTWKTGAKQLAGVLTPDVFADDSSRMNRLWLSEFARGVQPTGHTLVTESLEYVQCTGRRRLVSCKCHFWFPHFPGRRKYRKRSTKSIALRPARSLCLTEKRLRTSVSLLAMVSLETCSNGKLEVNLHSVI